MHRIRHSHQLLAWSGIFLFNSIACGPLQVPMGIRLDEKTQADVDAGWRRAMEIDDELGRQGWLDLMVGTFAFQYGVDRFHFTSEKEVDDRLVVMEVRFDRTKPEEDFFEITVFDGERRILRKERYHRSDVEGSIAAMYDTNVSAGDQSENWKRLVQDREARRNRIQQIFPRPETASSVDSVDRPADATTPTNRQ